MFDHRCRIIGTAQLGDPAADVLLSGVAPLLLLSRVEDPEVGRCIAAGAGHPLPVTVVGCQVVVEQLRRKVSLSPSPVYEREFGIICYPQMVN